MIPRSIKGVKLGTWKLGRLSQSELASNSTLLSGDGYIMQHCTEKPEKLFFLFYAILHVRCKATCKGRSVSLSHNQQFFCLLCCTACNSAIQLHSLSVHCTLLTANCSGVNWTAFNKTESRIWLTEEIILQSLRIADPSGHEMAESTVDDDSVQTERILVDSWPHKDVVTCCEDVTRMRRE